jgi:hypothetical protein
MLTKRTGHAQPGDRPAALSISTVNRFLLGPQAPLPPPGEPGRWQFDLWTDAEQAQQYRQHRAWLLAEAKRRGLRQPWAERVYGA